MTESEKERKFREFKELFPEGTIEEVVRGKGGELISPIDELILRSLWGIEFNTPIECIQHGPKDQVLCYGMDWNIFYSMARKHYPNFESPLWSVLGSRDSAQWLERERGLEDDWPSAQEMTNLFDSFGNFLELQDDVKESKEGIDEFRKEFPLEWARIEEEMSDSRSKEKFEDFLKSRWDRRKRMGGY